MGHGRAKPLADVGSGMNPSRAEPTKQGRSFISGLIGAGAGNTDLTNQKPTQGQAKTLEGILGAHKNVGRARSAKIVNERRVDQPHNPSQVKKDLTLIATSVTALAALRNPTAAITRVPGLIAKTRKPA